MESRTSVRCAIPEAISADLTYANRGELSASRLSVALLLIELAVLGIGSWFEWRSYQRPYGDASESLDSLRGALCFIVAFICWVVAAVLSALSIRRARTIHFKARGSKVVAILSVASFLAAVTISFSIFLLSPRE